MSTVGIVDSVRAQLDPVVPTRPLPYLATVFLFIILVYSRLGRKSNLPFLNPKGAFDLTGNQIKKEFDTECKGMLSAWFVANPDKAVRLNCDTGTATVLPPKFAVEVSNDRGFDLFEFLKDAYHVGLPGFDGFKEVCQPAHLVNSVIQKDLTKALPKLTKPASEEAGAAIDRIFTDKKDFHPIPLGDAILQVITCTTSRVFLGEKICRNEEWLKTAKAHAAGVFTAGYELRLWPAPIRPIVHWFLPKCREARAQVDRARDIIMPVVIERRVEKAQLEACGKSAPEYNDAIGWFERATNGNNYDPIGAQLALSFSSIYTTTDMVCQVLINIAQHPEILEPLREEIRTAIGQNGWQSNSLFNMKLLDSVMKETQRLKPIESALMRSLAVTDVKLSDGTVVPKGDVVAVASHQMWDPETYPDPEKFDPYRFYRMRQEPGKEATAQVANTSVDQYGFGLGRRACPGRFFATNSAKIVLTHILMKYDWKLQDGFLPKPVYRAFGVRFDPGTVLEARRREVEFQV
ncbi:dihydroML-236B monooxygenase mlcC [Colletotrichum spaethianum]|uniref:DihydroML-236B monooxygenase mlcC n=1 Tax=Colletotrichum spaethianum TaxID=700344 RepID=A0AA37PAT9_9PEZI|nr:dihydroML-236B monooxygenase mlcC [Colletotrichum spaethianum]GKT48776.1 dihydroML-236B monooxygenase mlcC [Colletotrichum spaethianum]